VPNFINIGQVVAKIAIFRFYKMAAVQHLGFVYGYILTTREEYLAVFISI